MLTSFYFTLFHFIGEFLVLEFVRFRFPFWLFRVILVAQPLSKLSNIVIQEKQGETRTNRTHFQSLENLQRESVWNASRSSIWKQK